VHFQSLDVSSVVDNQLKEELIDRLEVGPSWVRESFFLHYNNFTSSIPMPSPGSPCFLSTGRGLKMFF